MDTPHRLLANDFRGTLSKQDRELLGTWLAEMPINQWIYDEARRKWSEMGFDAEPFTIDKEAAWELIVSEIKPADRLEGKFWKTVGRMFYLLLAAFIVLGLFATLATFNVNTTVVANERAQRVDLPDGTVAYLDSGTTIRYSKKLGQRSRTVNLSGDAIFETRTLKDLPLTVRTPSAKLITNGGTLEVFCSDRTTEAIAIARAMECKMLAEKVDVEEGKMVQIDSVGQAAVVPADYNLLLWKSGVFVADSIAARRLVRAVEKFAHRKVVFKLFVDMRQPISFSINRPTPQMLADSLAAHLGMEATVEPTRIVFY